MRRVDPRPGEVIDRRAPITFRWNGRRITGFRGDTIVSALSANGVRVISRSFKFHRPRGVLTADIDDPNCLLEVDGVPNVRAAHRRAEDGMEVVSQGSWPSLQLDLKRGTALLAPFAGPGFYYKTFMAPRRLRPLYRWVLRHFSPGGHVLSGPGSSPRFEKRYVFPDVVVAGGGPAGMSAALSAAQEGARVLLVESCHELGGHLRFGDARDLERLGRLRAQVAAEPSVDVLTDADVIGRYDGNRVGILERSPSPGVDERLSRGRPIALIVATGLIERPLVFPGNDLPGVMVPGAVRRLLNLYAVLPGDRAVVVANDPVGSIVANELGQAGAQVVYIRADEVVVTAAHGRGRLERVELSDGSGLKADLLVTSAGWSRHTALLGGGQEPQEGVFVTGGLTGVGTLDELIAHATETGYQAARRVAGESVASVGRSLAPLEADPRARAPRAGIVDFCEDVSVGDIVAAAGEGYDSIELAKRYTTATMGNDQGKLSAANLAAVLAHATGRDVSAIGATTIRPPSRPLSLGVLAGVPLAPHRQTPMHRWHEAHGARFVRTGDWLRPDSYGDPLAEVRGVRDGVGVMDVSALGKLALQGPDVARFLDLIYVNRWESLAVGSVRYGVMVGEDGVVFDDGVTGRIDDEHYLMSTTSSGSDRVHRWLEYWLQVENPDWRVWLTPMTDGYAAVNVAGPRARILVSRVAERLDLSPHAFPHMAVRRAEVAGIPDCLLWRLGFTGELSYEIFAPASYGLHLWERIFEAGKDLGLVPFGVEAQRTMRIEKGHPVVGQDTDALTGPFAAGLGWAVKDKATTIGRDELEWQRAHQEELAYRLVGLQTVDRSIVPPEASQIVDAGTIIGRVTSSRYSPTLGRSVALALVKPKRAVPGSTVTVRLPGGRPAPAVVLSSPVHLDPEGERMRG